MGPIWFAIACSSFDISLVFGLIWSSADIEVFYWIKGNVWDQFVRFVRTQICFEEDTSSPFFSRYAITVANNMSARSLDQSHFTIRDERRTILHIDKFIDLVSSMRKILEWITSKRCKILLNLLSLFFSFFFISFISFIFRGEQEHRISGFLWQLQTYVEDWKILSSLRGRVDGYVNLRTYFLQSSTEALSQSDNFRRKVEGFGGDPYSWTTESVPIRLRGTVFS